MGLPILKGYFTAVVLDQIKHWFANPVVKPWCQLEHAKLQDSSPLSLLMAPAISADVCFEDHPTIQAACEAWPKISLKGNANCPTVDISIPLELIR